MADLLEALETTLLLEHILTAHHPYAGAYTTRASMNQMRLKAGERSTEEETAALLLELETGEDWS